MMPSPSSPDLSHVAVVPRRPFCNAFPDGYRESDRDYVENNLAAAVALLDAAQARPQRLTVRPAALAPGFYWYLRKAGAAIVVEKREGEAFVRMTNAGRQSWLAEGEAFVGPLVAPLA
ncbi:MAG TPA: hypothetical protein VGD46_23365 [Rhizobacter sp.]